MAPRPAKTSLRVGKFLCSERSRTRKEACWALSNIAAGTAAQIDQLMATPLLPEVIGLMGRDEFEAREDGALRTAPRAAIATPYPCPIGQEGVPVDGGQHLPRLLEPPGAAHCLPGGGAGAGEGVARPLHASLRAASHTESTSSRLRRWTTRRACSSRSCGCSTPTTQR